MAVKARFTRLISESGLKKLAGETYFERGLDYFEAGAVVQLSDGNDGIAARVQGSEFCPYAVRFWVDEQELRWGCTCPLGTSGEFCKHLVAAGLAWLSGMAAKGEPDVPEELQAVRDFLEATDRRALATLVLQRALWDEDLLGELILAARAFRSAGGGKPTGRPDRKSSTRSVGRRRRPK